MRLIDADILIAELKESALHHCNNPREDSLLQRDRVIVRAHPTVEAIPKADYEARLKADMVAVLEVIKLRIDNLPEPLNRDGVNYCIQEKINELKGDTDATNGDIVKSLLTITDEWTAYNFAEDCKEVNIKADEMLGVSSFKKSWWDAPYGR